MLALKLLPCTHARKTWFFKSYKTTTRQALSILLDYVPKTFLSMMEPYLWFILQVTVPSLASVYNEYALKSQYDTSIYLQVGYR